MCTTCVLVGVPEIGVTDDDKPPRGCWGSNPRPLNEHQVQKHKNGGFKEAPVTQCVCCQPGTRDPSCLKQTNKAGKYWQKVNVQTTRKEMQTMSAHVKKRLIVTVTSNMENANQHYQECKLHLLFEEPRRPWQCPVLRRRGLGRSKIYWGEAHLTRFWARWLGQIYNKTEHSFNGGLFLTKESLCVVCTVSMCMCVYVQACTDRPHYYLQCPLQQRHHQQGRDCMPAHLSPFIKAQGAWWDRDRPQWRDDERRKKSEG